MLSAGKLIHYPAIFTPTDTIDYSSVTNTVSLTILARSVDHHRQRRVHDLRRGSANAVGHLQRVRQRRLADVARRPAAVAHHAALGVDDRIEPQPRRELADHGGRRGGSNYTIVYVAGTLTISPAP